MCSCFCARTLPLLLLAAGPAYGCIVVDVPDGDTLTLFCDGKKRVVDLAEIAARGLWSGEAPVAPWEWRRLAAAEAEAEAAALARRKAATRTAPPPQEPDNPLKAFFERLFGQ